MVLLNKNQPTGKENHGKRTYVNPKNRTGSVDRNVSLLQHGPDLWSRASPKFGPPEFFWLTAFGTVSLQNGGVT